VKADEEGGEGHKQTKKHYGNYINIESELSATWLMDNVWCMANLVHDFPYTN